MPSFTAFNQHILYLVDPEGIKPKHDGSNYFDSLIMMENFLRSIIEPKFYAHLNGLTSIVAQPALHIYYWKDIMPDPSIADRLRRNT
jgi:hypothetical protein